MFLDQAQRLAERIAKELGPFCTRVEVAGEVRRRWQRIQKLCLVVEVPEGGTDQLEERIFRHAAPDGQIQGPPVFHAKLSNHMPLEVCLSSSDNWGSALIYRTGPAEFVKELSKALWRNRFSWDHSSGISHKQKLIGGADEKTFFELLQIPFIEPWERDAYTWPDFSPPDR